MPGPVLSSGDMEVTKTGMVSCLTVGEMGLQ